MGGRPRKNTEALKGAMTKEEKNSREKLEGKLQGDNDKIVAPVFLKFDEVALEKFNALVEELNKVNLINNVDVDLLAVYSDTWSKYVKSTKILMAQPLVEEEQSKNGMIKSANPYIKIQQSYAQQLFKLASLFGLSPADRTRIGHNTVIDESDNSDPLLNLLSGLRKVN